jgi:hypothetical protein
MLDYWQAIDAEVALLTWPDFDVPPQLRAVGGAGGDGRGATGVERDEAEEEVQRKQSKRGAVARPVHVQDATRAMMDAGF